MSAARDEIARRAREWCDEQGCTEVHRMREMLPALLVAERDAALAEVEAMLTTRIVTLGLSGHGLAESESHVTREEVRRMREALKGKGG